MKKKIILFLALLACVLLVPVRTQADTAVASIDTAWAIIGMPRVLHLEVTVAEGADVQWPKEIQRNGFSARDYDDPSIRYTLEFGPDVDFSVDTVRQGNMMTLQQDLRFFAFDSAVMVIEPFKFVVNGRDTLSTPMLGLKCNHPFVEVPDDPQAMQGLKAIMEPDFVIWDYVWWMVWVLLVLAVGCIGYFLYRFYQKHWNHEVVVQFPKEKLAPPHVVALEALQQLGDKKLWQNGQYKAFYTELTDILRRYIERRYQVSAMESTTDEIMAELVELTVSQRSSYNNLHEVLQLADFVKFAKYEPLPDENQMAFMNSRLFVEQTKETVVESAENNSNQSETKEA
ncbi:MAG: hypothetical protein IJP70_03385 [Bacteroidales bacterium]|nr:hypothetical protein [Bacteroidales bacterium]